MASMEHNLLLHADKDDSSDCPVAIVTGGSSGIGKGIVKVFLARDWNVVFCSNQENEGKALEEELNKSFSSQSLFVKFDASNESDIKNVIVKTVQKFGKVNCLVNNVGTHPPAESIDDFNANKFRELFELNVMSYIFASKFALPYLRQTKGSIVNVASIVANIGQDQAISYCATKGAIISMTKALAVEEASRNVRVNSISPSNILTPLWERLAQLESDPEEVKTTVKKHQLLRRFGTPEECGRACYYLAAEATFTTGVDLMVTGGAEIGYGIKATSL